MRTTQMSVFRWSAMLLLLMACDGGPKAIPAEEGDAGTAGNTGVFAPDAGNDPAAAVDPAIEKDLHTVIALEALPTSKYVYVRVKEGDAEFWIATTLQEVAIGRGYFYRGGLLKTNFPSKEYNRTFERLYLVSQLVPSDHGSSMEAVSQPATAITNGPSTPLPDLDIAGTTKIAALLSDPKKYGGKTIQVSGKCTKVNPNIMGRNWIHVKDGSSKDAELVVTTGVPVAEGQEVTMIGTVALDKDFGAGYKYDILLEGARLVK